MLQLARSACLFAQMGLPTGEGAVEGSVDLAKGLGCARSIWLPTEGDLVGNPTSQLSCCSEALPEVVQERSLASWAN